MSRPDTIVLIHGFWVTPRSWEHWIAHYEARGFTVHAPAYPGFEAGPYKEYSEPWFGDHKVLRGGCWATSALVARPAYRNFYKPDRRDVWAGFRTCALEPPR